MHGSLAIVNNPNGKPVEISQQIMHELQRTGEWKNYSRRKIKYLGQGYPKRICLLLDLNGIGDDIQAMPAIYQKIQEGFQVDIFFSAEQCEAANRDFSKLCFSSLGCQIFASNVSHEEVIIAYQKDYGIFYNLRAWCSESDFFEEDNMKSRFQVFADLIETELPQTFDWRHFLCRSKEIQSDKIIVSLKSSSNLRSYPHVEELKELLPSASFIGLEKNTFYPSFEMLVRDIDSAKCVIAVDNGILALALALRTPCIALLGGTNKQRIVFQYAKYSSGHCQVLQNIRTDYPCEQPCGFLYTKGFAVNGKCAYEDKSSDCMNNISPEFIFESLQTFMN